jgi:uncharacterized metal-binding protein YceD (DUF177 family)
MSDPVPARPTKLRTGGLSPRKPTHFSFVPDVEARAAIAAVLDIPGVTSLHFTGVITPTGRDEMTLTGTLKASVVQACVITLAPVAARIEEDVRRRYVADLPTPEGDEAEMPEDDSTDPMPEVIDLAEVATEALALALPLYPRAPGATLGEAVFAESGVAPLAERDLKPFAGLAEKLGAKPGTDGSGTG